MTNAACISSSDSSSASEPLRVKRPHACSAECRSPFLWHSSGQPYFLMACLYCSSIRHQWQDLCYRKLNHHLRCAQFRLSRMQCPNSWREGGFVSVDRYVKDPSLKRRSLILKQAKRCESYGVRDVH
ncbi:hypothetical protein FocTR4_00002081 [Fusarium oxysporum f. sp. cubense]|nr:hypothetical protein FocTR4_00002081 [Fusarium oxysporum f. sp. cubense]